MTSATVNLSALQPRLLQRLVGRLGNAPGSAHRHLSHARSAVQQPLPNLLSTAAVADVQNGTMQGSVHNVSDAAVGASALSRIRAIQSAAAGEDAAQQSLQVGSLLLLR